MLNIVNIKCQIKVLISQYKNMSNIIYENELEKIIKELRKGKIFGLMTDTVSGIICKADESLAIKKIYSIKEREEKKPIGIFLCGKSKQEIIKRIEEITEINGKIKSEVKKLYKNWPGALTIIYRLKGKYINNFSIDKKTIGIRMPNDLFLQKLLSRIDFDLAQTSLNISGDEPCKEIDEIIKKFGDRLDFIIMSNKESSGISSTIVDVTGDEIKLIRNGSIKI